PSRRAPMTDEIVPPGPSPARRGRRRVLLVIALLATAAAAGLLLVRGRPAEKKTEAAAGDEAREEWFCPMHPHVVSEKPGQCPICKMELAKRARSAAPAVASVPGASMSPAGEIDGRKVLYWYDPMAPGSKFDKPGKSPFMDMQLLPKYADEVPSAGAAGQAAVPSVSLSAEAIRATGVATVPVTLQDLKHEIRAVGTVEPDETRFERVAARVAGRVERLHASFTGQAVRRGAPLYTLYSPDLVSTQREYLLALGQQRRLSASGSAEAGESARELVRAARDRLKLWGIGDGQIRELERTGSPRLALTFVSPISGTVLQKSVIEGQYVQEGTELYLLADLSSVWLVAQVYEFELGRLRIGQAATATASAYPGREFEGRIAFIEPVLDRETRTVRVRIVLANRQGDLKPGMFAYARLQVPIESRLSIPRSAVIDTGTRRVVYVEITPGTFQPREVTLGPTSGDRVAVLGGVKEGEKVVATANFFIDSQAQLAGGSAIQYSGALDVKGQPTPSAEPGDRRP
ncbi:MAG: efflux RND transporter periplasmic adaptor subunit, partial [Acidobacteriota bacterium]